VKCFKSGRYEPYVVISAAASPRYDERFTGYGKNKIQFIQHIRFAGFRFFILPREFLIHFPHPRSLAKFQWLLNPSVHRGVDGTYRDFIAELSEKFKPVTSICGHHLLGSRKGEKPKK
jgi:hypothetical protein